MPSEKVIKVTRKQPTKNVTEIKIKMFEEAKKEHAKREAAKKR